MARDDGKRYGAGGVLMEIVEPKPEPKKKQRKRLRFLRKELLTHFPLMLSQERE